MLSPQWGALLSQYEWSAIVPFSAIFKIFTDTGMPGLVNITAIADDAGKENFHRWFGPLLLVETSCCLTLLSGRCQ